jgi:hypothetical protein
MQSSYKDISTTAYRREVPGIYSLRLYEAATCQSIIGLAKEADEWTRARVNVRGHDGGYCSKELRRARSALAFTPPLDSSIRTEFDRRMEEIIKPLVNEVWHVKLAAHSGTHVVRYAPGDHYTEHTDTGISLNHRYFSIVCYLNEDFEGGHTNFPRINYRAAPETGRAIIFPSTYVHRAETVTAGEKFVLVSWLNGPQPVNWL